MRQDVNFCQFVQVVSNCPSVSACSARGRMKSIPKDPAQDRPVEALQVLDIIRRHEVQEGREAKGKPISRER